MFIRPLCDLKCGSIFTMNDYTVSGYIRGSSGFDDLLRFHSEVSKHIPNSFEMLKGNFAPEHVDQVGGKIIEYWESSVWKFLQYKMEDMVRRDVSSFICILPNSSSRSTLLCVYLQAGIKYLFSSGNYDDHGSIGRIGAVWVGIFNAHASSSQMLGLTWEEYVLRQNKDTVTQSLAEQSTSLCLRPFCEVLKEILVQCSMLKHRNGNYHHRIMERINMATSLLLTQLFLALAFSELNRLVGNFPASSWMAAHVAQLLHRTLNQHSQFFSHMLENNIAIPAHPYFEQRFGDVEGDLRRKGDFERSLYSQVSHAWAELIFNELSAVRRANMSPPSVVRSMCEGLSLICLRPQIAHVSCCAAEFSSKVIIEAVKRLQPPHRFAVAAEIASIPPLIQFLHKCNSISESDKLTMTPSQKQLVCSAVTFREGICRLLVELSDNSITEPELNCLETPADSHSSLDMGSFLRLPQVLFPELELGFSRDLLKLLRERFDSWKVDNKKNHQIFCFLSQFFEKSSIHVLPIPPNTAPSVLDGMMLSDLIKNHEDFVQYLNTRCRKFSIVDDGQPLYPRLRHFCDCSLFFRQFRSELQKVRIHDITVCSQVTDAVLASIEALFIRENTTFLELIELLSTGDEGAFSFSSRTITLEKEVAIIESWFSNAATVGGQGARRVNTERVKNASKILQYRTKVGEASGAIKSLRLVSDFDIKAMDQALGVNIPGQLMERLHDNSATLTQASALLAEIAGVFEGMEPSALDIIIHIDKAKAALNFLRQQDVAATFNVTWANAESRAMGNPFITSVLDKLDAVRKFLRPLYTAKLSMSQLASHFFKFGHVSTIEELKDQLNTVAQQWSSVEWYFHSGDNQATLALLGHFQKSGRFQSMGRGCPEGPSIRFCYRMGEAAVEQYFPHSIIQYYFPHCILLYFVG
jgi:hypothetical protein